MTPAQKADAFVRENPKHIDEDGYFGAQCWDVVAKYARVKYGCPSFPTGSGGAEGLWRLYQNPIPQYFYKQAANTAQPGDIAVFPASFSPPWGHTALILSRNGNTLSVYEQNGNNPGGDPYKTVRYVSQLSGVLSPKDKGETIMKVNDADNEYWRWNKLFLQIRGRNASREEFRNAAVGREWLTAMEILSDDPEADRALQAQGIGQVAVRDNWEKQINDLLAALKVSNQALSDANANIQTLQQQIKDLGSRPDPAKLAELQKAVDTAVQQAKDAQAQYEKAHAELIKLQQEKETDTNTGNSFIRWIGGMFNKLKGGSQMATIKSQVQDEKAKRTAAVDGALTIVFQALGQLLAYGLTLLPFLDTFQNGRYSWAQFPLGILIGALIKAVDRKKHEDSTSSTGLIPV